MNEWMGIESAPPGVIVELGRYRVSYDNSDRALRWDTDVGVALVATRTFWGRTVVKKTYTGECHSHWRPLPAPPASNAIVEVTK